ncbi:MAG: endonuclease/exonuclease/phosphatase [Frankiales bacterium]|jgi:endonuclease/exonuclease/phosphatase (EEP) superfamily protein YafD|nr:endonuclease/exonuclease/phosphatase [Frankiales bacterium]
MHDGAVPPRARTLLLVSAGVLTAVPFLAGYGLPQRHFLLIGLAALAGWSPYALAPVLLLSAALRNRPATAALAALLALQVAVLLPAYLPDDVGEARRVVVLTANLALGEADAADVVRLVRERHVEVLALVELTPAAVGRLQDAGLDELLPHSTVAAASGAAGAGLWSRQPLVKVPSWRAQFATAAADVGGVRFRAVHPFPPLRGQVSLWRDDYEVLTAQARQEGRQPTVLLGDFNASVHHRPLRGLLGDRWRDAASLAGAGLVRTWGPALGAPALLDPDHVLVDRGMSVDAYATAAIRNSDHRAVVATVVLPTRR